MPVPYTNTTVNADISGGVVTITIGQESNQFDLTDLVSLTDANNKNFDFLRQQIGARLGQLEVDLDDVGAVKAAIESGTYQY